MTSRRLSTEQVDRRLRSLEPVRASDDFTQRVMDRLPMVERPDPRWYRLARLILGPQPLRTALAVATLVAVAMFLGVLSTDRQGTQRNSTVLAAGQPADTQRVEANLPVMRVGTPVDRPAAADGMYSNPGMRATRSRLMAVSTEAAALRHEMETLRALIENQRAGRSPILVVPADDGVDYWVQLEDGAGTLAPGQQP